MKEWSFLQIETSQRHSMNTFFFAVCATHTKWTKAIDCIGNIESFHEGFSLSELLLNCWWAEQEDEMIFHLFSFLCCVDEGRPRQRQKQLRSAQDGIEEMKNFQFQRFSSLASLFAREPRSHVRQKPTRQCNNEFITFSDFRLISARLHQLITSCKNSKFKLRVFFW